MVARNPGGGWLVAAGLGVGAAYVAYRRNAQVWYDEDQIAHVNLFGIETKCRLDELHSAEIRGARAITLDFVAKDGRTAFRINARLWNQAQITELGRRVNG